MKICYLLLSLCAVLTWFGQPYCEAILRPIIRLRPKIVLGKGHGDDDASRIYRLIAKTVISGYLFGAFRRPFAFPYGHHFDGSPLSVTFAYGKKPQYESSKSSSDEPKVEKIKIIEKEKEKAVKHIVISHKIINPPAAPMSFGSVMPDIFEDSAAMAVNPEAWGETRQRYQIESTGESSGSIYGMPEALGTTRRVKIVKVKESRGSGDNDDDEEDYEDEGETYSQVTKRQVYSYKDEPVREPTGFKYGYNPRGLDEEVAESTRSKQIVQKNEKPSSTDGLPGSENDGNLTTAPNKGSGSVSSQVEEPFISNTTGTSDNVKEYQVTSTTVSPDDLLAAEFNESLVELLKSEQGSKIIQETEELGKFRLEKELSPGEKNENQSSNKDKIVRNDDQQGITESPEGRGQKTAGGEVLTVKSGKKKSRKARRNRNKSKKSKSRNKNRNSTKDLIVYEDIPLVEEKVDSVKAFGDGWVQRRRKNKARGNRSSGRNNKKRQSNSLGPRYKLVPVPGTRSQRAGKSLKSFPATEIIHLPASSSFMPSMSVPSYPIASLPGTLPFPGSLYTSPSYLNNAFPMPYMRRRSL